jgi:hypothetical protein
MPDPSPFGELESRTGRRQGIPPSRTGARTDLVAVPPTTPAERPMAPPKSAPVEFDELVKTTIHLGKADDALLNLVSFTGKQSTPKVDASRSAVVRLALRRLAEAMTPEEIVGELRRKAPKTGAPGRPRLK